MAATSKENVNKQADRDLPVPVNQGTRSNLGKTFNAFVESLEQVLVDITALEVNTMVVERITGDKFIPWEAYRDLYPISSTYLEQQGIHESLRDRYIELRKNLELEYMLLLSDPTYEFYDHTVLDSATQHHNQILSDPMVELEQMQSRLPDPYSINTSQRASELKQILKNGRFLRSLRKMSELKGTLDNRNKALHKKQDEQSHLSSEVIQKAVKTDMIYAQTVIQLDGDLINRYSEEILAHPHRDVILQIHRDGVLSGQKQWREMLEFVIDLVQASLQNIRKALK
ncbi:MAG: hypothetical protein F6J96_15915 [Symploca sp. SIO1C2]|nr:hypothetical protein [Symploca sp. SIO1C2]